MSVEDKKRLGRRFFKGYTKLVESKYWYNHYVALIFGASPASNLGSLIAIDWKGNELISVTRFFGNNDNVKLYLGSNPETNMYELWLGLIGLDGDGSEFIIQSRESIDLDSKTVETLPSYLKVISISWQKNNDFSELGELLGNPKGTKSFSSWSEFTDFVNEMPIKTIQPFVSNFNAFAGEGFYGNVVQGLVIKQLEDAVFIFGIAIDGTLIFRKRNYPDVSTWEDPKIIIHSNNWHKIYFVTDLGELIGINDTWIRRRFAIKDCNTAIAGAYNVDDSTTNNFPTGAYKFGTLLVANSGFFGSQYFVPDNFNVDPYIYIRSISNNGNSFNKWAKIKVTIIT